MAKPLDDFKILTPDSKIPTKSRLQDLAIGQTLDDSKILTAQLFKCQFIVRKFGSKHLSVKTDSTVPLGLGAESNF